MQVPGKHQLLFDGILEESISCMSSMCEHMMRIS